MNHTATTARPGIWLDSDTPLTAPVVDAVVRFGAVGVMRYVPLPANNAASDIAPVEADLILSKGLQLLLVQHVRAGAWDPRLHDPGVDAAVALLHAKSVGYAGHLYLDLESIAAGVSAEDVRTFANGWFSTVKVAGFGAGLYHGFDAILSAAELFHSLICTTYWTDMAVRPVMTRGNAIVQGPSLTLAGTTFDRNTLAADLLGEVPMACTAAPTEVA